MLHVSTIRKLAAQHRVEILDISFRRKAVDICISACDVEQRYAFLDALHESDSNYDTEIQVYVKPVEPTLLEPRPPRSRSGF